ncbi:hypothetical protein, partial [Bacteroides caccae]|uniref:hypothetical protein n=1 Tax=Bacteroides caccae TaxID=47678 RepID=UPI0032EF9B91
KWAEYFEAVFLFTWAYICFTFEGLFCGSSGDCFTSGLQMGLKRPGRALFSAVWPFCGWAGDLVIWGWKRLCGRFFCAYF